MREVQRQRCEVDTKQHRGSNPSALLLIVVMSRISAMTMSASGMLEIYKAYKAFKNGESKKREEEEQKKREAEAKRKKIDTIREELKRVQMELAKGRQRTQVLRELIAAQETCEEEDRMEVLVEGCPFEGQEQQVDAGAKSEPLVPVEEPHVETVLVNNEDGEVVIVLGSEHSFKDEFEMVQDDHMENRIVSYEETLFSLVSIEPNVEAGHKKDDVQPTGYVNVLILWEDHLIVHFGGHSTFNISNNFCAECLYIMKTLATIALGMDVRGMIQKNWKTRKKKLLAIQEGP